MLLHVSSDWSRGLCRCVDVGQYLQVLMCVRVNVFTSLKEQIHPKASGDP